MSETNIYILLLYIYNSHQLLTLTLLHFVKSASTFSSVATPIVPISISLLLLLLL